MRHLNAWKINDHMLIRSLARNKELSSHPHLRSEAAAISIAYMTYLESNGNAHSIEPKGVGKAATKYLHAHYKHPPASHKFIKKLRDDNAAMTCTMCGSPNCGTLDHVLPKAIYPEFSLFSANLVPACLCNNKRKDIYRGKAGERVLHPYFDSFMNERLVTCRFRDHDRAPSIEIVNNLAASDANFAAVDFHINNVVKKSAIIGSLRRDWGTLVRKPSLINSSLGTAPASKIHLARILSEELHKSDDRQESKNSWLSIFVSGLLEDVTLDWLFSRLTTPGRCDDAPLIAKI
ncbi:hypothetical protein [Stenotrophomonas geniculata]|uniref:hypothetical protein n=1 Tax=Stenotrophomonas geniculata TaxID=86188 RepID=UPI002ACD59CC|nr:hypothetical protein [Stenotrophomonas geniculata]